MSMFRLDGIVETADFVFQENRTLRHLNLSYNDIGDIGADIVAAAIGLSF